MNPQLSAKALDATLLITESRQTTTPPVPSREGDTKNRDTSCRKVSNLITAGIVASPHSLPFRKEGGQITLQIGTRPTIRKQRIMDKGKRNGCQLCSIARTTVKMKEKGKEPLPFPSQWKRVARETAGEG